MRAITFCFVIAFTVLLALPESTGAPTCDCDGSDKVLSETIKKDASKSSERSAQEEKEATETQSRCSNGLVSGSKAQTESRQLSEKEEEQSHTTAEKKTATGTELVEESVKKKKEVTISEKKTVLVYYLVSYKKLPAQNEGECRIDYYKRVFPKEDNDNVFYRKIFKAYEHEGPKAYIERVEFIFNEVYPEKDCRLDVEWLEHFDHYYTLKYSRKIDESDESYYPRVLQKLKGETKENYKKRMECLVAALDEEDFSHITFDDSEVGYKIGKRTTPAKSVSSPASSGEQVNQVSSSSKKSKEEEEADDKSESAIQQKSKKGTYSANKKKHRNKKTSVEKEENTKSYAYRVAYDKLPKICTGEKLETYYKKYFGEYNAKMSPDAIYQLYFRILVQYRGESVTDYVKRIDFLFDNVYPELDLRTNIDRISLLEHYYRVKYAKDKKESQEDWFVRVLAKQKGETVEHYKQRVACLKATIKKAKWEQVVIDASSATGFRLVSGVAKAVKGVCGCKKRS